MAWADGERVVSLGIAPPAGRLRGLAARLAEGSAPAGVLAATRLVADAGDDPAPACGALAMALPGGRLLAVFRREFVQEVHWGGDPTKPVDRSMDGRLSPRGSFALWREMVRGSARAWLPAEQVVLAAAGQRLATVLAADPAAADRAWESFAALALSNPREVASLAELLLRRTDLTVLDGEDAAAPALSLSDPLSRLLGLDAQRLVGRPWRDIAAALRMPAAAADLQAGETTVEAFSPRLGPLQLRLRHEPALRLSAPGLDRRLTTVVIQDQTHVLRMQDALGAAVESTRVARNARAAILRNTNHELRTPLSAILGYAEMIGGRYVDERNVDTLRGYSKEILRAGRHQLSVIETMLDLAMIDSGHKVTENQPFDLTDAIADAAALCQPLFAEGGITFTRSGFGTPLPWYGNARILRQAVVNLLGNAAKFTPFHGEVRLSLHAEPGCAEIVVSDTGPGIPAERRQDVFRAFVQGDETTTRRHGGLGLGLFISRAFVEQQGGTLAIDGGAEAGACFRIRLPQLARAPA